MICEKKQYLVQCDKCKRLMDQWVAVTREAAVTKAVEEGWSVAASEYLCPACRPKPAYELEEEIKKVLSGHACPICIKGMRALIVRHVQAERKACWDLATSSLDISRAINARRNPWE